MNFRPFPPGEGPTCPKCGAELISGQGATRTTLAMGSRGYDDEGKRHNHDPNWSTGTYECENDHTVKRRTRKSCPAEDCDYGGEEELSVVDAED